MTYFFKIMLFLKKSFVHTILFLISISLFPLIILTRIIKPFYLIRFGTIRSDRIGHFIADSAEKIALKNLNKSKKVLDIFWIDLNPVNDEWAKLISKHLPIYYFVRFLYIANDFVPGGKEHATVSSLTGSKDIYGYYYKYNCKFNFEKEQENFGKKFLENIGWDKRKKIVCLNIRDEAYLNKTQKSIDWTYHNFRNSNIQSYKKAVQWLIKEGYFVIRVGNIAKTKIDIKDKNFLDYPFIKNKNNFLDFWIVSFSSFCISSGSGIDEVAKLYKIPILFINKLPLRDFNFYNNCQIAPKKLVWIKTKKNLNLLEYLNNSWDHTSQYKNNNIKIIDLNNNEIYKIVKNFFRPYKSMPQEKLIEKKIYEVYKKWFFKNMYSEKGIYKHPKSKINSYWLKIIGKSFFDLTKI